MTQPIAPPIEPLVVSLLERADAHPEQGAIVTEEGSVSYGDFGRMVRAAAIRLTQHIGERGEGVGLIGSNSASWAAAYFAIHMVGGVVVPNATEGVRLIISTHHTQRDAPCLNLDEICEHTSCSLLQSPRCASSDIADRLNTTGTVGQSKGVVLTHGQIAHAARNINEFIGENEEDCEVVPISLNHSFGLGRLRVMALVGHTLLLDAGMRNPAKALKRILDTKATGFAMVPGGVEMILRLTNDRIADAREHLRYIELGSMGMPLATKQRLMALLPTTRICHHYGLTEASRAAFIEYHSESDRLDSVGRASPNVEIAIVDENGKALPDGEIGEIAVRGPMVMQGYWNQPELTKQVLHDGWLRAGDLGRRSADGYLYLVGRKGDVINVAGLKVGPEEIEDAINEHPAVIESAVMGIPDPQGLTGECIKARVVLRMNVTDTELITWLRGHLVEYKIPRVWERVERIAKTPSGKIRRHLM